MICIEMKQENLYQIVGISIGNVFNVWYSCLVDSFKSFRQ